MWAVTAPVKTGGTKNIYSYYAIETDLVFNPLIWRLLGEHVFPLF